MPKKGLIAGLCLLLAFSVLLFAAPAYAQSDTVADIIHNDPGLTILAQALDTAGLTQALRDAPGITILAPSDIAFQALGHEGWTAILADTDFLKSLLAYHTLNGVVSFSDIAKRATLPTAAGQPIYISRDSNILYLNSVASFTVTDIPASNGIVHIINAVLLPADAESLHLTKLSTASVSAGSGSTTTVSAPVLNANAAHIRLVNAAGSAGAVSLQISGTKIGRQAIGLGEESGWVQIAGGTYPITVMGNDNASVVTAQTVTLHTPSWLTVVLTENNGAFIGYALNEDYSPLAAGQARISLFHAIPDAGLLNIFSNNQPRLYTLAYPATRGNNDGLAGFDVAAGDYDLQVVTADTAQTLVSQPVAPLSANTHSLVVLTGSASTPQAFTFITDLNGLNR